MKIILTFTLMMIPGVMSSMNVTGYSGDEVNITCKYDEGHTANAKYFCKGQWLVCTDQIKNKEKDKWVQKDRFSLYDDTRSAVFTVTIRNLTEEDSGTYYCAVDRYFIEDPYTEVNLKVIRETPPPSSSSSSSSFSSVRPSAFTGSSLIVPLVLVLLVLIIAGLLLLFLCKKHQSRAGGDSSSQTGPEKHEVVSHTGCDYEEIKDTHKQLPTNPSDSSKCIYATVEKATGDSQRCITSAEDLNYTVVNFHKDSDCPDSVSFRNNQDYSEYAAVNHLTA